MAIGLTNILKWKKDEGYDYVYFDEYSGKMKFLKESDLNTWFKEQYDKYCSEMGKHAVSFSVFCRHNQPDKIYLSH